jgi:hypothetical protein
VQARNRFDFPSILATPRRSVPRVTAPSFARPVHRIRQRLSSPDRSPQGVITRFILLGEFYDFSSRLIVGWFGDDLPNLDEQITENLITIEWEKHAVEDPFEP